MMSHKILNKLFQLGASLATITALTTAPSVQAATLFYDLKFIDQSGATVGTGFFSYDDTAPFEGTFFPPFPIDNVTISASEGWYKILSFEAQVNGLNWDITDSTGGEEAIFWAPFKPEKQGSVIRDRFGIPTKRPGLWFFGNPRIYPLLLVEPNLWTQFAFNTPTGIISGSWVATQRQTPASVPEPASILSLIVLGTGSLLMTNKNCKN